MILKCKGLWQKSISSREEIQIDFLRPLYNCSCISQNLVYNQNKLLVSFWNLKQEILSKYSTQIKFDVLQWVPA